MRSPVSLNVHSGFTNRSGSAKPRIMYIEEGDKPIIEFSDEGNDGVSHDSVSSRIAKSGTSRKEIPCQRAKNQESRMITCNPDTMQAMSETPNVPSVDVAREYIRLQIARLGLTEKDFCVRVGIPQSSINDILKNKRRAHFDHLDKINQALGIKTSSMFKVMCDIGRGIEESHGGYSALPGRARGYVLAEQKEAVKRALGGLRRPPRRPEKDD